VPPAVPKMLCTDVSGRPTPGKEKKKKKEKETFFRNGVNGMSIH